MPKLTVFFVRSGETTAEVATANLRLHEMLDPPLTLKGYQQAQETFSALVQGLCDQTPVPVGRGDSDGDGVIDPLRNLACFSAPFRACQSTALLLSAANLGSQDKLTWRYTTVEAATSPSAVPVLTVNELAAAGSEITKCGGIQAVVDAGLLHAAAAPWNDTKNKCPFVRVCVRDMKRTAGDFVKTWKADRHVNPPRRVLDVQYLQLTDDTDPWSLTELTPKINVTIDMLEPKKYLPPPRKGNLECKLSSANRQRPDEEGPTMLVNTVESCVTKARQVGCDTIIFTVPGEVLQHMAKTAGGGGGGPMEACSVLTLTAVVHATGKSIDWTYVGLFTTGQLQSNLASAVPYFPGPVDCIVPPPEGKDPSSVPANQWSRFPPPEPEKIPDDYPDIPPFGSALSAPVPNTTRSPPPPRAAADGRRGRGRGRGRAPTAGRAGRHPNTVGAPPQRQTDAGRGAARAPEAAGGRGGPGSASAEAGSSTKSPPASPTRVPNAVRELPVTPVQ